MVVSSNVNPAEIEAVAVDEYYQIHSANSDRQKKTKGTSYFTHYWTMSPNYLPKGSSYYGYELYSYINYIQNSGARSSGYSGYNYKRGVSLRFAL